MPNIETIISEIENCMAAMHMRPGEPVNLSSLAVRLTPAFRITEVTAGLTAMEERGSLGKNSRGDLVATTASCPLPNDEEVRDILIQAIASANPRSGDHVRLNTISMRAQPELRASEITDGLEKMVADDLLSISADGTAVVVTDIGADLFE